MNRIRSVIIHPFDPEGNRVGGISTFIKGFIRFSPPDFDVDVVGVSADPRKRPVGEWSSLYRPDGSTYRFLPLLQLGDENKRTKIPLGARFFAALSRNRKRLDLTNGIIQFHRIEPSLALPGAARVLHFVHMNVQDLANPHSEIRWSKVRGIYNALEEKALRRAERVLVVNEGGVNYYRTRYADQSEKFEFCPTWVDDTVFRPSHEARAEIARKELLHLGLAIDSEVLLFVGRLELQKDPLLLIESFARLAAIRPQAILLIVGDGSLRTQVESAIAAHGLTSRIRLLGKQPAERIAALARASHFFLMTSAFEGMPIALLEAQACGLPALVTKVGEVGRIVQDGISGMLIGDRSPEALAAAWAQALEFPERFASESCVNAIAPYTASEVLGRLYSLHREWSNQHMHAEVAL